jgi:hypothetical protein
MTRKTGAKAVKARQLMRAAKVHRYKQKLKEAGESLGLPKPSKEAQRQKDEELKRLYLELISKKEEQSQAVQPEQPAERAEKEQAEQQVEQKKEQPQEKIEEQKQAEQQEEA